MAKSLSELISDAAKNGKQTTTAGSSGNFLGVNPDYVQWLVEGKQAGGLDPAVNPHTGQVSKTRQLAIEYGIDPTDFDTDVELFNDPRFQERFTADDAQHRFGWRGTDVNPARYGTEVAATRSRSEGIGQIGDRIWQGGDLTRAAQSGGGAAGRAALSALGGGASAVDRAIAGREAARMRAEGTASGMLSAQMLGADQQRLLADALRARGATEQQIANTFQSADAGNTEARLRLAGAAVERTYRDLEETQKNRNATIVGGANLLGELSSMDWGTDDTDEKLGSLKK